jgi:hypothetical protein
MEFVKRRRLPGGRRAPNSTLPYQTIPLKGGKMSPDRIVGEAQVPSQVLNCHRRAT